MALASNGGVASASSYYTNGGATYPPQGINNGDRKGIGWSTADGGWASNFNENPTWCAVTFPVAQTIDTIDVVTEQDRPSGTPRYEPTASSTFAQWGVTAFKAQYWNGSTWVTVPGGDITSNNLVWRRLNFPPVSTTAVRVLSTAYLANHARIIEVEAWTAGTVNPVPPAITIVTPAAGATIFQPSPTVFSANVNPTTQTGGVLSKIELYRNGVLIDTRNSPAAGTYSFEDTGADPGSHTYAIRAYDVGNNYTEKTVTISVVAYTTAVGNWAQRASSPGVIMARRLAEDTLNDAHLSGRGSAGDVSGQWNMFGGRLTGPQMDTNVKPPGSSASVKFTVSSYASRGGTPDMQIPNVAGDIYYNFGYGNDLSQCTRFGPNSEFFVQYRRRIDTNHATTLYLMNNGDYAAYKVADITGGDTSFTAGGQVDSSANGKFVTHTYQAARHFIFYQYNDVFETPPIWHNTGPDQNMQPGSAYGYCSYNDFYAKHNSGNPAEIASIPQTCIGDVPNVWQTFKYHIQLFDANPATGKVLGRVRVYMQYDTAPSVLWFDVTREWRLDTTNASNVPQWGKIWLFVYQTSKSAVQDHPDGHVWYAELIVSTQDIPDVTDGPPLDWLPLPGQVGTASDVASGKGTVMSVDPNPSKSEPYSGQGGLQGASGYNGLAYVSSYGTLGALVFKAPGGHGDYFGTADFLYDIALRQWKRLNEPVIISGPGASNRIIAETWNSNYFADYTQGANGWGSAGPDHPHVPASSHTYWNVQPWPEEFGGGPGGSVVLIGQSSVGRLPSGAVTKAYGGYATQLLTGAQSRVANPFAGQNTNQHAGASVGVAPACFDTTRGYVWRFDDLDTCVSRLDLNALTRGVPGNHWVQHWWGGGPSGPMGVVPYSPMGYCPTLDRLVLFRLDYQDPSQIPTQVRIYTMNPANPEAGWVLNSHTGLTDLANGQIIIQCSITWCDDPAMNCFALYSANRGNEVTYCHPPATDGGQWTFSTEVFTGGTLTRPNVDVAEPDFTYSRFQFVPAPVRAFLWVPNMSRPVQVAKPLATA